MKILNIYNGDFLNSSQGGGMRYLRDLMAVQHRLGYDIHLMAVGSGEPRQVMIGETPVTYIPVSPHIAWPKFLWGLFRYLSKHWQEYATQIVHIHRVYFAPVARMVRHARLIVTVHSETFARFEQHHPKWKWTLPVLIRLERWILNTCVDRLSVAGESARDLYHQRHHIDPEQVRLLRCPSLMHDTNRRDPELTQDLRKIILFVGRLAPVKRPHALLELFRRATVEDPLLPKEYRIVFVGDGEIRPQVEEYVRIYKMENDVTFLGEVPAERMPGIYAAAERLVLLSSTEVAPFVIKEALTSGLPVLATDVGINAQYVPPQCGMLIPPENPEQRVYDFLEFLYHDFSLAACKNFANHLRDTEEAIFTEGLHTLYQSAA